MGRWAHTWTAAPQLTEPDNLPPAPYAGSRVMADATLRQTVRISAGGERIRLRFSNAFGTTPLALTRVTVALPSGGRAGVSAVVPGTVREVTFRGRASAAAPAGAQVVSDPVDFPLADGAVLAVTAYLAEGQAAGVTSHPGSRTTSHLAAGDRTGNADLADATPVEHWYFLSGVEVEPAAPVLALLGDSLTDGRGSTTNGHDRWPDLLFDRLGGFAAANQAIGGNRVLGDGLGPGALARLDRDVLALGGVRWLIVFEGVNDLGTAPADGQESVTADLIAAYGQIAVRAHAHDILVYGATLTPFGGHSYDDPRGRREAARQTVNTWIRTAGAFDAVIDFDRAVRDPADPRRLLAPYDGGDHLHLGPAGYRALAGAVPEHLL
ncbi:SGNH/GDSL hydrolase family protein [Nonomuraea sp. NPDC048826]|uniref:SGNH/GDSL hydrolase family protein n=1 Tax=Nonomuraea sp. NPDC048826 TaxID=3364347 RepID=UPI00372398D3